MWQNSSPEKPPRDIVLCLKGFLIKEEILYVSHNTYNIQLDGVCIQLYLDISTATLEKRRKMTEVPSVLQNTRISYSWGFPFKLQVPHNETTYKIFRVNEGKEL